MKLNTPDYRDLEPEAAVADFKRRRAHYMSVYEPLEEHEGPHIKIINSKRFIGTCGRSCAATQQLVYFNSHILIISMIFLLPNSQQHSRISASESGAFHHELAHPDTNILFDASRTI